METNRRGFLRWTAAAAAMWLGPRRARAASGETALAIHRATRNTPRGAVGAVVARAFREPLPAFKAYPGRQRIALPAPSWSDASPRRSAQEPCSREQLARILFLANGVTQRGPDFTRRAAPSAGALYAGELYAVVERVSGVAPGVYSYAVDTHELVLLREGSLLGELSAGAAFGVLIANVFERYSVRYANRGYRYALIDTGHIGENVRLAARELGLHHEAPLRFEDDRLNTLLGVDGREEAVCAVHFVGRGTDVAPARGPRLVERQQREPGGAWRELPMPLRYHEATKLVAVPGASAVEPALPAKVSAGPDSLKMPVHEAIRVRRSAHRFEPGAMQRADLLNVLAFARGGGAQLDLLVVAHRVTDTAPGLYRYDAASRSLAPLREGDHSGPLVRTCLGQARAGEAAAALIGVARLAETSAAGGARSYRDLLLDAGATAQRIYLGAEALGLAARNLAAYLDDRLDALLGLDSRSAVAVHLTVVGPGD